MEIASKTFCFREPFYFRDCAFSHRQRLLFRLYSACTGGVDGNAYSFNLATTVNDAVIYGAVALKARTYIPGAGYTERLEFLHPHAVNPIGVAVEDKSVSSVATVAIDGSFDGLVDRALVALEIRPQGVIPKSFAAAENQSAENLFPAEYQLEQNYPNPFSGNGISGRSSTLIAFSLPAANQVTVSISMKPANSCGRSWMARWRQAGIKYIGMERIKRAAPSPADFTCISSSRAGRMAKPLSLKPNV